MSAAYRHHLAGLANCLLGYAAGMWRRAADAASPGDRNYFEKVGHRYFAQSCELIDWADALAVNPAAPPQGDMAIAVAQHTPPPRALRRAA